MSSSWSTVTHETEDMRILAVDYGKRYWFLYFWLEAVSRADQTGMLDQSLVATQEDKARFQKGATGARKRLIEIYDGLQGVDSESKLANLEQMKDDKLCDILTELLRIGFRGVPSSTSSKDVSGASTHASNILSCCSFGKDNLEVQVGWRAEDTPPMKIIDRGGWKRQVDVAERSKQLNMDKKWHPYHQKDIKKYLWFRAGKNIDNCFYSVISIGHTFEAVLNFPEIDDTHFSSLPHTENGEVKAVREWTPAEKVAHPGFIATVKTTTEARRQFLASKTYAYLFLLKGLVLDTARASTYYGREAYPEEGVAKIGLDDIYACWPVVRVFHEILGVPDQQTNTRSWVCGKAHWVHRVYTGMCLPGHSGRPQGPLFCRGDPKAERAVPCGGDYRSSPVPAFTCAWRGGGEGWAQARPLSPLNGDRLCEMLAGCCGFNPGEERVKPAMRSCKDSGGLFADLAFVWRIFADGEAAA